MTSIHKWCYPIAAQRCPKNQSLQKGQSKTVDRTPQTANPHSVKSIGWAGTHGRGQTPPRTLSRLHTQEVKPRSRRTHQAIAALFGLHGRHLCIWHPVLNNTSTSHVSLRPREADRTTSTLELHHNNAKLITEISVNAPWAWGASEFRDGS